MRFGSNPKKSTPKIKKNSVSAELSVMDLHTSYFQLSEQVKKLQNNHRQLQERYKQLSTKFNQVETNFYDVLDILQEHRAAIETLTAAAAGNEIFSSDEEELGRAFDLGEPPVRPAPRRTGPKYCPMRAPLEEPKRRAPRARPLPPRPLPPR